MLNLEAGGHTDTHRGLTVVKDARLPTRSLSSFASHFLSSIICSFCLWRVSCNCCRSLCHSRCASSLLLASTRRISPSYRGINTQIWGDELRSSKASLTCASFLPPCFDAAGIWRALGVCSWSQKETDNLGWPGQVSWHTRPRSTANTHRLG